MGKKLSRKKAAVSQQLHTPPMPIVIMADTENEPHSRATTVIEPVRQLNVHPFEALLTGARNTGMADGLQTGARMQEELEMKLLESQEYIEKLEQWASGEGDHQVTEIANSWTAGRKSGLEEGADMAKAELLPQLEQLKQQVSGLENTL